MADTPAVIYSTSPSTAHIDHHAVFRTAGGATALYCDGFTSKRHADKIACALNSAEDMRKTHHALKIHHLQPTSH